MNSFEALYKGIGPTLTMYIGVHTFQVMNSFEALYKGAGPTLTMYFGMHTFQVMNSFEAFYMGVGPILTMYIGIHAYDVILFINWVVVLIPNNSSYRTPMGCARLDNTGSVFCRLSLFWMSFVNILPLNSKSNDLLNDVDKLLGADMFARRVRNILQYSTANHDGIEKLQHSFALFSSGLSNLSYAELPRKLKKSERKPWVTSINELKRKARLEKLERKVVQEATLNSPENGLLVKGLIPVAHDILAARAVLFACISKVAKNISIYVCSFCGEVHVGHPPHKIKTCNFMGSPTSKEHNWERGGVEHVLPLVESFHLYDRLGRAVSHNERLEVDRIPAILELCIQAGVNISEYPTRRREFPIYCVAGRMIDFERRFPHDDLSGKDINGYGFWEKRGKSAEDENPLNFPDDDIQGLAKQGMEAWERMRSGAIKLMKKYAVQTCGYCCEVQVGPKGHRVRQCQAYKHQMRDGQHAWQEATIDDLVPPVYVWHVRDLQDGGLLIDCLKRYYGKLPAVVELFARAGAHVGENYVSLMREDIALPKLQEEKWVV
ncbi:hypothetical protein U1Q18_022916 [Sarracenia purpurea var. burkii]